MDRLVKHVDGSFTLGSRINTSRSICPYCSANEIHSSYYPSCSSCGASIWWHPTVATSGPVAVCPDCGGWFSPNTGRLFDRRGTCKAPVTAECGTCGGDGLVDGSRSCGHGRYSTHSYCGHGRVGLHD